MLLYHSLTSPFSRKVRAMLLEKGVPFEGVDVATPGRSAAERNPLGKVPTLVLDDGMVLFDSVVITEALDAIFPQPRLIPAAPLERALVRRWEALADGVSDVLIPVVMETRRPEGHRDAALVAKLEGKVHAALSQADAAVVGREFLHGGAFSLADIALVAAVGYVKLRRPELLAEHAATLAFCEGLLARPCLAETVPPNLPPRF